MEIERLKTKYRENSIEEFFNWLSRGDAIEVRILSDKYGNKFKNYEYVVEIAQEIHCDFRFTSLFLTSWSQMEKLLKYNSGKFRKDYNVFVGINPRRRIPMKSKKGTIYKGYFGGKAGVKAIRTVFCDIEHKHRSGSATEEQLQECIEGAKFIIKALSLDDYYINCSGNGAHLLFSVDKEIDLPLPAHTELEDKLLYNNKDEEFFILTKSYNKYVEHLNKLLNDYNPKLIVDEGAKDCSRIGRFPGFWNVKVGKIPRQVGTIDNHRGLGIGLRDFFASAKHLIKGDRKTFVKNAITTKNHRYTALTIRQAPLVQLLLSGLLPSNLSRNHYLEQSMARLLRDNDIQISEISNLVNEISLIQQKQVQVDPSYLSDENPFTPEAVNSYCFGNKIDFIYKILEEIPDVTDGFYSEEHYNTLNRISDDTIAKMSIDKEIEARMDYQYLKDTIRKLVDVYSRLQVLFKIKIMYKENWDYLDRNKIVLQLINKTRKSK